MSNIINLLENAYAAAQLAVAAMKWSMNVIFDLTLPMANEGDYAK